MVDICSVRLAVPLAELNTREKRKESHESMWIVGKSANRVEIKFYAAGRSFHTELVG